MEWKDFKGLKWYILFSVLVITFHAYSLSVGWKWINSTKKETNSPNNTNRTYRFFQK
jgi:hypothetical protein